MNFKPGDRVQTPVGNFATVLPPAWAMPSHTLIQIDDGAKVWILTRLLSLADSSAAFTTPPKPKQPAGAND